MADTHEHGSKVLALVFTDLADSTALKTQRGDAAIASLISRHTAHIKRLATDCGGRIIDWAGDGCFLTFETSSSAVLFALRVQQAHAEEADLPGVRIGIHMGEVTVSTNEDGAPRVAGLAVDLAARISGLARPGQVLMSAAVYDSARQRIGVESLGQPILWQAHGTYALKGFDKELEIGEAGMKDIAPLTAPTSGDKAKLVRRAKPAASHTSPAGAALKSARRFMPLALGAILVLALLGAAYLAGQFKSATPAPVPIADPNTKPIKSLAVLPLENLSNDPDQEYFADGMTEAITSELAKIKSLRVVSRTSVMRYKNTDKPVSEIARELGVDGIIEGSVLKDGGDIRITAQLIRAATDSHLWSETYTDTLTSVLDLQAKVALAIADALNAELTGDERQRFARSRSVRPEAHDAYLLGLHFLDLLTNESLQTSIRYLEEATRLDPTFAEAWARLANSYRYLTGFGFAEPGDIFPKARAADLRALELDPDLVMAHVGLARTSWSYDREWAQAEERFHHALDLDPNYAAAHTSYALFLVTMGRRSEAIEHAERAFGLDPDDPWNVRNAQMAFLYAGRPERAKHELEQIVDARPDFLAAHIILIGTYSALGEKDKALAAADQWVERTGRSAGSLVPLAEFLISTGENDRAREILNEAVGKSGEGAAARLSIAYASLGEFDTSFEWMERSFEARDFGVFWFRVLPYRVDHLNNPNMIRFRNDARFHEIMDRMKYPPLPPDHPGYAEEQAWLAKKRAAADANAPITKIAVLPFKNISGDPQQEFFVDGMTEALISELAKIKSIKVISRTSAMHFKDSDKKLSDIAAELGVDGVVEGSAMKAGNEVRITAQLIRAATDDHLWADSYTETIENVLKMQAQVALAITTEIKAVVTPDESARVTSAKKINIAAYELYVQARHFWSLRSPEGFRQARELFIRSLEIDSDFALGHVGLADTYFAMADYNLAPSAEMYPLAQEEAEKAIALDPAAGEAYVALALIGMGQSWDWKGAEEALLKSIELSPNYTTAHQFYSLYLSAADRPSQAVEESRQAYLLDPASPIIAITYAQMLARVDQTQESFNLAERVAGQYPGNARVLMGLGNVYSRAGRYDDALAAAERMGAAEGNKASAAMQKAVALAHLGRRDDARRLIEDTVSSADAPTISSARVAVAYAALEDRDRAIEWLTKAVETHDPFAWRVKLFPEFDTLESDPRFQALLRRMNFPE